MGVWDRSVRGQTRQKLVTFRRPYKPLAETQNSDVQSFALHSSSAWGHPSAELVKEIGDGVVVSHTHTIYEGMEIITLVVLDT